MDVCIHMLRVCKVHKDDPNTRESSHVHVHKQQQQQQQQEKGEQVDEEEEKGEKEEEEEEEEEENENKNKNKKKKKKRARRRKRGRRRKLLEQTRLPFRAHLDWRSRLRAPLQHLDTRTLLPRVTESVSATRDKRTLCELCNTVRVNASLDGSAQHRIGKHRALSLEVTCNFRLYLQIGQTSINRS